jgi:hypothetical protein
MENSQEEKRQCGDCEYFYQKNESEEAGQCRRYAPHPTNATAMVAWPKVTVDSWCGEFYRKYQRADERKAMEAIYQPAN